MRSEREDVFVILFVGDLYDEEQILQWLMTQKDPSGDVIETLEGEELLNLIRESESLAVYFCKCRERTLTATKIVVHVH